jgi:hypothetical protein
MNFSDSFPSVKETKPTPASWPSYGIYWGVFLAAVIPRLAASWYINSQSLVSRLAPDSLTYSSILDTSISQGREAFSRREVWLWNSNYAFLQPAELAIRLSGGWHGAALVLTSVMGALLAVLTCRVLVTFVPLRLAIVGALVVGFMPSQIAWSSMLLKDAFIAVALVLMVLAVGWWYQQSHRMTVIFGVIPILICLLMISRLRTHTLVVVLFALVLATLVMKESYRTLRAGMAIGLLIVVPYVAGVGPGGVNVLQRLDQMDTQRLAGAHGAATAVVPIPAVSEPGVADPGVADSGVADRLLGELVYLPSGLKVMLLDPMPWHLGSSPMLVAPFAEHLLWYPLLILAAIGVWRVRNWTPSLTFMVLCGGGSLVMWSLTEGNFGTAFRHRTEFVWMIVVLAMIAVASLLREGRFARNPLEPMRPVSRAPVPRPARKRSGDVMSSRKQAPD